MLNFKMRAALIAATLAAAAGGAAIAANPMVGGAAMYASKSIVANAVKPDDGGAEHANRIYRRGRTNAARPSQPQ